MSKQQHLLRKLWVKALQSPEPVQVPCGTPQAATALRFALYAAVRSVRRGEASGSPALKQAIQEVAIGRGEGDPSTLVLRRRMDLEYMQGIEALVGEEATAVPAPQEQLQGSGLLVESPPSATQTEAEHEAAESLARLEAVLQAPPSEVQEQVRRRLDYGDLLKGGKK